MCEEDGPLVCTAGAPVPACTHTWTAAELVENACSLAAHDDDTDDCHATQGYIPRVCVCMHHDATASSPSARLYRTPMQRVAPVFWPPVAKGDDGLLRVAVEAR